MAIFFTLSLRFIWITDVYQEKHSVNEYEPASILKI